MANDQYVPPIMRGETRNASELIADTPERFAPGKPYGELVEWGQAVRSYRPTQLALNQAAWERRSIFDRMTSLPSGDEAPRTMKDLLNREFAAGGAQLSRQHLADGDYQLFGLTDTNPDLEARYGEPVLDYMYAHMRAGQADPLLVITYRVTPSFVEKIYGAHSYQLTISELQNFKDILLENRRLIRHEFYPIDDLIESDEDDYEEIDPRQSKLAA